MTFNEMKKILANSEELRVGIRRIWLKNKNLKFIYYVSPSVVSYDNLRNEAKAAISLLAIYDTKPEEVNICGHFDMYAEGKIHIGVNFTQMEINDPSWTVMSIPELVKLHKSVYEEVQKN